MNIEYPNLAGIATAGLVEKIGAGSFSASYINWSRTMHLLRENAPGWLPEMVHNSDGGLMHRTPIGAYLLIRFVHISGATTPAVPQAIMNNKNNSIALEAITSRDLTDTQVRGICKAAALTFGLAYELWAKMPLESGYAEQEKPEQVEKQEPTEEEMKQAIIDKDLAFKKAHDEALEVHQASVDAIKKFIAKDDAYAVAEAWRELDESVQRALWIAPSKGGCFTTAEREYLKTKLPKAEVA